MTIHAESGKYDYGLTRRDVKPHNVLVATRPARPPATFAPPDAVLGRASGSAVIGLVSARSVNWVNGMHAFIHFQTPPGSRTYSSSPGGAG